VPCPFVFFFTSVSVFIYGLRIGRWGKSPGRKVSRGKISGRTSPGVKCPDKKRDAPACRGSQVRVTARAVNQLFVLMTYCRLRDVAMLEHPLWLPVCCVTQATDSAFSAESRPVVIIFILNIICVHLLFLARPEDRRVRGCCLLVPLSHQGDDSAAAGVWCSNNGL
jgi:hypothetical protein